MFINPSATTLVIVDMQRGFCAKSNPDTTARVNELLRHDWAHVIATQFFNRPSSSFVTRVDWSGMMEGAAETALIDSVAAAADLVLPKYGYSCPGIEQEVGTEQVLIVGVQTDACVQAVATQLFDAGFLVSVDIPGTDCGCLDKPFDRQPAAVEAIKHLVGDDFAGVAEIQG